jgi:hypothetical protein
MSIEIRAYFSITLDVSSPNHPREHCTNNVHQVEKLKNPLFVVGRIAKFWNLIVSLLYNLNKTSIIQMRQIKLLVQGL